MLQVAATAATVVFCVAMRWLSTAASLETSARSWSTTILLFVVIYLIPLGGFHLVGTVAMFTGTEFQFNLGPAILLLMVVFVAPLIHFFLSTSRMGREARTHAG
jgi:hypothetical protein